MMVGLGKVHGGAVGHGGAGYGYDVEAIVVKSRDHAVGIVWTDPCDDEWAGTKIVRKTDGHPKSVTDGVLVVDSRIRNQYAQAEFLDTDLENEEVYYYVAFPYSSDGVNTSYRNRAKPVSPVANVMLEYTGAHTVEEVIFDGVKWQQWTLIGSGMLRVVHGRVPPLSTVWMCSGGGNGGPGNNGAGGLGAYASQFDDVAISGPVMVQIGVGGTASGAASGSTSFGDLVVTGVTHPTTRYQAANGGTGAGLQYYTTTTYLYRGDGLSKYPFGDNVSFAGRPHCPGGGGGGYYHFAVPTTDYFDGGAGGTNGANGGVAAAVMSGQKGGAGGSFGGGNGSDVTLTMTGSHVPNATSSTFYGGGSGGMFYYAMYSNTVCPTTQLPGYQGVAYLRIPLGAA